MSITEARTAETDEEVFARWVDHPFVRRAFERHPDAPMVVVLDEVLSMLVELEELFPGVPFGHILGGDTDHVEHGEAIRAGLLACGVETKIVDVVMEPLHDRSKFVYYPTAARLADLPLTWQELTEVERISPSKAKRIVSLRKVPTPAQVELAELVLDEGKSIREVALTHDVAMNTVKWSAMRVMYHRGER